MPILQAPAWPLGPPPRAGDDAIDLVALAGDVERVDARPAAALMTGK